MFGTYRQAHWRSTGSFSLSSSEHLSLMQIFLRFLEKVAMVISRGRLEREVDSYRCLALVVSLVKQGKLGKSDAGRLQQAIELRGRASLRAYPDAPVTMHKLHWLCHVALQLARDGWLLDCFVGERNQSVVKATALSIENTHALEASVTTRMVVRMMSNLEGPDVYCDR